MKKYEGKSVRKVKTEFAKLPDNIGFPKNGGGVIDKAGIKCDAETQLGAGQGVSIGGNANLLLRKAA